MAKTCELIEKIISAQVLTNAVRRQSRRLAVLTVWIMR